MTLRRVNDIGGEPHVGASSGDRHVGVGHPPVWPERLHARPELWPRPRGPVVSFSGHGCPQCHLYSQRRLWIRGEGPRLCAVRRTMLNRKVQVGEYAAEVRGERFPGPGRDSRSHSMTSKPCHRTPARGANGEQARPPGVVQHPPYGGVRRCDHQPGNTRLATTMHRKPPPPADRVSAEGQPSDERTRIADHDG